MTTLLIEHLKASDLPPEGAGRLQVRLEQTVTVRIDTETGEPAQPEPSFTTDDPAFGIWRDDDETLDVAAFVRRLRAPRYHRDGSRQPDGAMLVDTDVLIWHPRGYPKATQRLDQLPKLTLSAVTYLELLQ